MRILTISEHTLSSDEDYFLGSHEGRDGGNFSSSSSRAASPAPSDINETRDKLTEQQREDELKVHNLVQASGGLFHDKPLDPEAPPKRKGMTFKIFNEELKCADMASPAVKVPRPDEQSLRRLTKAELMPPPSFVPEGISVEIPVSNDLVRSQDIIFLVVQKVADDINACLLYTSPSPRDS